MSMPAAEKRKIEIENQKNERINHIIECTFGLFADNGIENISMNEIAIQAEIGVASLYRYFQTKEELAIKVAVYAWELEESIFHKAFSSDDFNVLNGFEQMKVLLELFTEAVVSQRSFFRFVYYFDAFITKESISPERLNPYQDVVTKINKIVIDAFNKGLEDGSINFRSLDNSIIKKASDIEMCFTMLHSLFCLAQKLSISGEILIMDKAVDGRKQIEMLVSIMLETLKNRT